MNFTSKLQILRDFTYIGNIRVLLSSLKKKKVLICSESAEKIYQALPIYLQSREN